MGKVVFWKFWLLSSILVVKLAMEGFGKILCSKALFSKLNWLHIVPMLSYDFVTFTTKSSTESRPLRPAQCALVLKFSCLCISQCAIFTQDKCLWRRHLHWDWGTTSKPFIKNPYQNEYEDSKLRKCHWFVVWLSFFRLFLHLVLVLIWSSY